MTNPFCPASRRRCALAFLAAAALVLAPLASVSAQVPGYASLFDPLQVLNLNLEMDPSDWNVLRNDTDYSIYKPAYFWADGENKILVEVRRKPTEANGDKISLKIDINEYFDGLQWHGVKKLSLENGYDTGPVAEGFAWYLHRRAAEGLPGYQTPLASWVNVTVNGDRLGLYTNVEQPDKMFLRNRDLWVSDATWLYKQGEIGGPELHVGTGDSPAFTTLSYRPFQAQGPLPPAGYESTIANLIDMRQMLMVGAVNAFTCNPDELFNKGKNFFFADFTSEVGQRLYFPWDLDAVLKDTTTSIYGKVDRKTEKYPDYQQYIMHNAAFHNQYNDIVEELLNGPLAVAPLHDFLNQLEAALTPHLLADPYDNLGATPAEIAGYFAGVRQWVTTRHANVVQQLQADRALHPPSAVPEPAAWLLLLAAAAPAAALWRRRSAAKAQPSHSSHSSLSDGAAAPRR